MTDIRNVHAQLVAVAFPADGDGIIQILGILAIDGDGLPVADILPACHVFLRHLIRDAAHLLHNLRRILVRNAISLHDG